MRIAVIAMVIGAMPCRVGAQLPDSTFSCSGAPIERLSGRAVAHGIVCIRSRSDTTYVFGYTADHREVWRVTGWRVPRRSVDSVVAVLEARIDRERGPGRSCGKSMYVRVWGAPPHVLALSIESSDMPTLSVGVGLSEGVDAPKC